MPAQNNTNISLAIDWIVKLLSASMIPVLLWVKELEVQRAVHSQQIQSLESDIATLKRENIELRNEITKSNAILPLILNAYQKNTNPNP